LESEDQFEGCVLGLALGDALGAPFEGGAVERLLWRLIGTTRAGEMRWTDDTQMSVDVAESLLARGAVDADDLARRFARSYRWSRGYGPGAARVLKKIAAGQDWQLANRSVYPEGSYGNGGAMRAPMLALFYARRPDALLEAVEQVTLITHAHPRGVEGALLVATATLLSLRQADPLEILQAAGACSRHVEFTRSIDIAATWLAAGVLPKPRQVAAELGNGIAAARSCVTALFVALSFADRPFEEMLDFVTRCGGDTDTLGAMAGAVWGARRGKAGLPLEKLRRLEQASRLSNLSRALYSGRCAAA